MSPCVARMSSASRHGAVGAAVGHERDVDLRVLVDDRRRHQALGRGELAREAVEHDLVLGRVFRVRAVLRVARAAREVGALRMHARQRAVGNAVAVHVEIAMELLHLLELLLRIHLAAIGDVAVIPLEIRTHPVVHADVEIGHHEDGRLQPFGEIEGIAREVEALLGIARKQAHVLGVAVRGVRGLRGCRTAACAWACRWTARRAGCRTTPRALRRSTRDRGTRSSARRRDRWSP